MTIRMYLILLFATILAFAGIARAEEPADLKTRLQLLDLDTLKIPPSHNEMMIRRHFTALDSMQMVKLTEDQINEAVLQKLLERAATVKLDGCMKTYEFDYFAYTAAGGSLFQNSEDPAVQKEQTRLYKEVRTYLINGKLTQRDPAAAVDPELAAYCEGFASGQADVLAVQVEGIHGLAQLLGQVLTGAGGFLTRLSGGK